MRAPRRVTERLGQRRARSRLSRSHRPHRHPPGAHPPLRSLPSAPLPPLSSFPPFSSAPSLPGAPVGSRLSAALPAQPVPSPQPAGGSVKRRRVPASVSSPPRDCPPSLSFPPPPPPAPLPPSTRSPRPLPAPGTLSDRIVGPASGAGTRMLSRDPGYQPLPSEGN
ncbi:uncharacterized protein [Heliangelus exortis]|uniref:uncharacterized protein n=1 Tax=Heliangelus exortis TaxID=472823 RepID=UPI003A8D28B1